VNFPSPETSEFLEAQGTREISTPSFVGVLVFAMICMGYHFLAHESWVPILDSANLVLHEAGHPIVGLFSERLSVYGGTVFQLLFPAVAAWHFRREGHDIGYAASLVWLGENFLNVARYMSDARAQVLPLVGGGEHDWTKILGRWNMLQADVRLAGLVRFAASILIVGACIWLYRRRSLHGARPAPLHFD